MKETKIKESGWIAEGVSENERHLEPLHEVFGAFSRICLIIRLIKLSKSNMKDFEKFFSESFLRASKQYIMI